MNFPLQKRKKRSLSLQSRAAFTIIEMITIVSIFAAIASIVLVNLNDFNSSVTTENVAQDIALVIRESQAKAVSGVTDGFFAGETKPSWGVRFNSNDTDFIHFADLNNNGRYNSVGGCETGLSNECRDQITLPGDYEIGDICGISLITNIESCGLNTITITFTRPFQEPRALQTVTGLEYANIKVEVIREVDGISKWIHLGRLGEISVQ